jgi:hypothetical protein
MTSETLSDDRFSTIERSDSRVVNVWASGAARCKSVQSSAGAKALEP